MSSFLQKHYRSFYLLLPMLLGVALGQLAATAAGVFLSPPVRLPDDLIREQPAPLQKPTLNDYQVILDRNIFDSTGRNALSLAGTQTPQPSAAAPPPRTDLDLFGTVTRGENSLAVIKANNEIRTYRLGAEVPGGGEIEEITRSQVRIKNRDGSVQTLSLKDEGGASGPQSSSAATTSRRPSASGGGAAIRPVGENRWVIPRQVAEEARGNINELLRQARVEPNIVEGRTEGFMVKMIQPRSLLANLGIQRGDVLMQINGVELDSPEKALQIFQQLREARNINIALKRNGSNMSFDYEVN